MQKLNIVTSGLLIIIFLTQCYRMDASLRLYNLNDGKIIEIPIAQGLGMQGKVTDYRLEDESFSGEYLFQSSAPKYNYRSFFNGTEDKSVEPLSGKSTDISFAEIYGFSKNAVANPVGSMVLLGNKGTIIDVVFYTFVYDRGTASGVGKDNKGNIYRVYIGDGQ